MSPLRKHLLLVLSASSYEDDTRTQRAVAILEEIFHVELLTPERAPRVFGRIMKSNSLLLRRVARGMIAVWIVVQVLKRRPQYVLGVGLVGLVVSKTAGVFRRLMIIYDANEVYCSYEGERSYSQIHELAERIFIGSAAMIWVPNDLRRDLLRERYRIAAPMVVIRNIVDPYLAPMSTIDREKVAAAIGDSETEIRIVYQGYLGDTRNLESFITLLKHLPSNYTLVMIARGGGKQTLLRLAEEEGVRQRIRDFDFFDLGTLNEVLQRCHLGIISYSLVGPNNQFCEPNKLYEYAYARLPCVTTPQKRLRDLFETYEIGAAIPPELWRSRDHQEMAAFVEECAARGWAQDEFDRFIEEHRWDRELEQSTLRTKEGLGLI